jgi:predicted RNA binding protein YcfA (HicA-like mRNA interferase family)
MTRLPAISSADAIRAFQRAGYWIDHQTGSHIILRHPSPGLRHLSIPNRRELAKGTLRGLIRSAGLTVDQFVALLNA